MWSLNTARNGWANWLRAIGQSSTYLGLALIGFIWISLSFHLQVERSAAERAAIQNSRNLVRVFEEHLSRSIHDIDRALKVLRSHYVRNPAEHRSRGLETQRPDRQRSGDAGLNRRSRRIRQIEQQQRRKFGVDYSGREHFRVHVKAATDELFIGRRSSASIIGKAGDLSHAPDRERRRLIRRDHRRIAGSELFRALLQLGRYRARWLCQDHRDRRHRPRRGRRRDELHRNGTCPGDRCSSDTWRTRPAGSTPTAR